MKKSHLFYPPHFRNTPVYIAIRKEYITFHYSSNNAEIYYIPKLEWINQSNNPKNFDWKWTDQMKGKAWFISEMRIWINKELGLPDKGEKYEQDEWTDEDEKLREVAKRNGGYLTFNDLKDRIMKKYYGNE